MRMGQTKTAGGYLQLRGWDRRKLCRWLLTAVRMGQTKTLQVATYSYEDETDEDSAGGYLQL